MPGDKRVARPDLPVGLVISRGVLFLSCCSLLKDSQISPGPLSKAHESLSGPLNCTKCHDLRFRTKKLRCMECHSEIRQRVTRGRGMHAVWFSRGTTGDDCVSCHGEHGGADLPLIRWQPSREGMDHSKTGFLLTGKHAGVDCNDCHKAANVPSSERASILVKDLNRTY